MQDYRYQENLIKEAYEKLIGNPKLPVIMACAPNAGKTRMAIRIADLFENDFANSNILFLTHGQILIREQWVNYFQKFYPENFEPTIIRKAKDLTKKHSTNVLVGLPQTLKRIKGRVDLLIVDEAHQRYLASEIQDIIKALKPKHQLLLTGTPSLFIRQQGFQLVGITLSELLRKNIVGDPIIELASSTYSYDDEDYNDSGDVSKYNFQTIDTNATLNNLLTEVIKKMASRKRTDPEAFKWCTETMDWKTVLRGFKKTMFVCANQQHARDVHEYFTRLGVVSSLSISDISPGQVELKAFTNDPDCLAFIVVHRGVLGFDYADLINLVDMSGTRNVDRLFQMLCRLVRRSKHLPDAKKLFLKVTNENQWDIAYAALSYAVGMSLPEIYYSTHKKYIQPFPVKKGFKEKLKRYRREGRPDHVDCPTLLTFKDLADFESNPLIWSVCYTTFKEVRNLLSRDRRRWTLKEALEAARQYKTRKEFVSAHLHAYRFICENGYHKELDKIFSQVRWTKKDATALAETYPNVNVFRKHGGGAYNFLRKNSKSTLDKVFSEKVGTRKGQAELPDDELIERIINDPLYDVQRTGEIFTRISPQGHVTEVWRRADWVKRDTGAIYVRYGHKRITSARVVYRKHVGKLERDLVVYHKDLNRKNNAPENLILSTQSRMMKEYYTKRKPIFGNKKITLEVAEQIRADHKGGLSYKKLIAKYGLSKSSISYLINGKTWNPDTAQGRDIMTGELAEKVRKEFKKGVSRYSLAQKYGLSNYQIRNAINNRSWKKVRGPDGT